MIVDEDDEDQPQVNNIVHHFNYTKTEMKKAQFLTFFKKYVKTLLDKLEKENDKETVDSFKVESQNFAKFLVGKFADCEFYLNEKSENVPFSALGIAMWVNESDLAPTFYYLKHGLKEVKF